MCIVQNDFVYCEKLNFISKSNRRAVVQDESMTKYGFHLFPPFFFSHLSQIRQFLGGHVYLFLYVPGADRTSVP